MSEANDLIFKIFIFVTSEASDRIFKIVIFHDVPLKVLNFMHSVYQNWLGEEGKVVEVE